MRRRQCLEAGHAETVARMSSCPLSSGMGDLHRTWDRKAEKDGKGQAQVGNLCNYTTRIPFRSSPSSEDHGVMCDLFAFGSLFHITHVQIWYYFSLQDFKESCSAPAEKVGGGSYGIHRPAKGNVGRSDSLICIRWSDVEQSLTPHCPRANST